MGGAKCLLVGGDLRNPQIHNSINENKNRTGLSKFLYDKTAKIEDLIIDKPLKNFNLDIILSGEIPPNPTDLLVNDRFGMFLEEAKKRYDYIVVDTAPTLLVTDTLLISRFADITLYSIRANYTDFELLDHLKEVKNGKKLKNIGIVLNGVVNARGYAYNYGYGYGYNADKVKKRSRLKLW
jgi:capsular exopolysaccharide synthesis family protein